MTLFKFTYFLISIFLCQSLIEASNNELYGFNPMGEELAQWREEFCYLPKSEGNCIFYYMPVYYYNVKTSKCEAFAYGGCNGNRNRFPTKETCARTCDKNALSYRMKEM